MIELGWRIGEDYPVPKNAALVAAMVEEIKALNLPKKPPNTIQEPSTQALLDAQAKRDPKDDPLYWKEKWDKELPVEAIANRQAESPAELVHGPYGARQHEIDQISHVSSVRKAQKNELGIHDVITLTPETREKGIQAFTYSPPADLSKENIERVQKMIGIKSDPTERGKVEVVAVRGKLLDWILPTDVYEESPVKGEDGKWRRTKGWFQ